MRRNAIRAAFAVSMLVPAGTALGHITLETQEAAADSYYKAVMRVGHGCEGSPTITVRIQVPEGVTAVKPQPKQDWQLQIVKAKLDKPITDSHGKEITERISEIVWTGGKLPDEYYDEFVMRVKLPNKAGETLYWPTVQECEKGVHRWIEIPEAGKNADAYEEPAPQLILLPKS